MNKYTSILETIQREYKTKTSPLDNLYIMGMCHAIQSISLNDNTITREEYGDIYAITEIIIKEIINI